MRQHTQGFNCLSNVVHTHNVCAALNRQQLAFNQASLGKRCDVLVERKGKHPGQWLGKSPWLQSVHFEGEARVGDMVTVDLTEAGPNSLHGELALPVSA